MKEKQVSNKEIHNDLKYNDKSVAKFINYIMTHGKKSVGRSIVYECFEILKQETKKDPRAVFNQAIKKVSPLVEVRGKRVGGANYQVPFQVKGQRRFYLGCRWIIEAAKEKKSGPMHERLANEILEASNGEGGAVKKRENIHRMAEANKAFAHFAR